MRYILSPLSKSGEGVGGGVTLYLITSVSAVYRILKKKNFLNKQGFILMIIENNINNFTSFGNFSQGT
ncbi:MAG: hypothetical protein ACKPER_10170 [Dolichospermum sp.]